MVNDPRSSARNIFESFEASVRREATQAGGASSGQSMSEVSAVAHVFGEAAASTRDTEALSIRKDARAEKDAVRESNGADPNGVEVEGHASTLKQESGIAGAMGKILHARQSNTCIQPLTEMGNHLLTELAQEDAGGPPRERESLFEPESPCSSAQPSTPFQIASTEQPLTIESMTNISYVMHGATEDDPSRAQDETAGLGTGMAEQPVLSTGEMRTPEATKVDDGISSVSTTEPEGQTPNRVVPVPLTVDAACLTGSSMESKFTPKSPDSNAGIEVDLDDPLTPPGLVDPLVREMIGLCREGATPTEVQEDLDEAVGGTDFESNTVREGITASTASFPSTSTVFFSDDVKFSEQAEKKLAQGLNTVSPKAERTARKRKHRRTRSAPNQRRSTAITSQGCAMGGVAAGSGGFERLDGDFRALSMKHTSKFSPSGRPKKSPTEGDRHSSQPSQEYMMAELTRIRQVLRRVLSKIDQAPRQHKPRRSHPPHVLPAGDNGQLVYQQVNALKQALEHQAMTNTLRAADSLYLEQQLTDKANELEESLSVIDLLERKQIELQDLLVCRDKELMAVKEILACRENEIKHLKGLSSHDEETF